MPRSLRSRLILASVLWTAGLLALMHMLSLLLMRGFPAMLRVPHSAAVAVGLVLMAAGLAAARRGLATFHPLRERLAAVHKGESVRVEGSYPTEVQPLIDDLNALLAAREKAVQRALAAAGDLAHGLKTPLALLSREAERAAASGDAELAGNIAQQVDRMSRQVNYHLARARAAASGAEGAAPCPLAPCAEALIRTLAKLHAGRGLAISASVEPQLRVRVERQDLDEMLGNLLDNACKWAASRVVVSAGPAGSMLEIAVDDDGPGLAPALRSRVLERGVKLDEAAPGSGLGLAIVRDLAELYGGSISLADSPLGGLRARLRLPAG